MTDTTTIEQFLERARKTVRRFLDAGLDVGLIRLRVDAMIKQQVRRHPMDAATVNAIRETFDAAFQIEST